MGQNESFIFLTEKMKQRERPFGELWSNLKWLRGSREPGGLGMSCWASHFLLLLMGRKVFKGLAQAPH